MPRPLVLPTLLALAGALVAGPVGAPGAGADDSAVNPLTLRLESLTVGHAREFRLAVVHPLFGPRYASTDLGLVHAADTAPDLMGVESARGGRVRFVSFGDPPALLLPGTILRGTDRDYAVRRPVIAAKNERVAVAACVTSDRPATDAPPQEPRVLAPLLPPALRWIATQADSGDDLEDEAVAWADLAELPEGRSSPAALPAAPRIAGRVAEYVEALSRLPSPPAGTELVGYVGLVDGEVAVLEAVSSGSVMGGLMKRGLEALAVECSLLELKNGLLDQEIPSTGAPDRLTAKVKDRILSLYGVRPRTEKLSAEAAAWSLELRDAASGQAVVRDGKLAWLLVLVRPGMRAPPQDEDALNPNVIRRKARPTGAETRFLERRSGLPGR